MSQQFFAHQNNDPTSGDLDHIAHELQRLLIHKGYPASNSTGLVSPAFPNTFNPSAAHETVVNCIRPSFTGELNISVIELCIRDVDLARLGDGIHSLLFEMLVFVDARRTEDSDAIQIVSLALELLKACGYSYNDLFFTVFGGADFDGAAIPADHRISRGLKALGVKDEYIVSVKGRNNFFYLSNEGDAAGPRAEIFLRYRAGGITLWLELGSIILENHYFSQGRLHQSPNTVGGAAVGLERLAMVTSSASSIQELAYFRPLRQAVLEVIGAKRARFFESTARTIQELSKALVFELSIALTHALSKAQSKTIKKHIRKFQRECEGIGLHPQGTFDVLADAVVDCYKARFPELRGQLGDIKHELLSRA